MKKIITIIFMVILSMTYGQNVTVSIMDLKVNNMNISSGAPINMGTNSSVNLKFRVDLAKNAAYIIGDATVYISVYKSDGTYRDYFSSGVPQSEFSVGASNSYDFDLLASDVDFGSGNYLVATLIQDNPPGVQWASAHRSIIKTPAFTLASSTSSIPCGSTSAVTFTVNGPSGTLTYNWNVGNGWTPSGSFSTTSNSIQLTPTSFPPSQVTVVPVFNGVNQTQLTKNLTLSTFNPTNMITGSSSLCTTATYVVSNLPAGITVTGWTSSNPNIATVSSNGDQATLTAVVNGTITLTATLSNACGQTQAITKTGIIVGKPYVVDNTLYTNHTVPKINNRDQFHVTAVAGQNISYYWWIVKLNSECAPNASGAKPKFDTGSGYTDTYTSTSNYAIIRWGNCPGNYVVNCRVINSCGPIDLGYNYAHVIDPYVTNPCRSSKTKIYPNPVKGGSVTVSKPDPNGPPCPPTGGRTTAGITNEALVNEVKIYDMMGNMVYNNSFRLHEFTINDMNLKNGSYIIVITDNNNNLDRELLVIDN